MKSNKLDESGVFAIMCASHDTPLRMSNMYGGEKFGYPELLLKDEIRRLGSQRRYLLYYDLGCKLKAYIPVFFFLLASYQDLPEFVAT